ncbi:MAG TPA: hypothetical protein VM733_13915 [Thermoanaerobaculia bacterium]|nr:hypothetical protein [Thermoanaerobaculia bacterium]
MRPAIALAALALSATTLAAQHSANPKSSDEEAYLSWSAAQSERVAQALYKRGRVGSFLGDRGPLQTERAQNYKLAATLFSADAIQATARTVQIHSRLSPEQTRRLVSEACAVNGLVVMIELDPREGSGVIPLDWEAFLQPKGQPEHAVAGVNTPALRNVKGLAGVLRRNYDYDRFWMVFPSGPDVAYAKPDVTSIELVVRINDQEGRVDWPAAVLRHQ